MPNSTGLQKLQRIEERERADRLAVANDKLDTLSVNDQRMMARITSVIVQADFDMRELAQQEKTLHEELKKTAQYKKLLMVREKIKWAKRHKTECQTALKKLSEFWADSTIHEEHGDEIQEVRGALGPIPTAH